MRIIRLLAIVVLALGFSAGASAQLVAGYGSAWYGPLTPPFYSVGGYSGYNAANASDFDFYNVGSGPFYWYSLGSGQTLPASPSMILNGTTLTVTQVNGNASTATALAATPTQCTTGAFATGIQANGDANCSSSGASIQTATSTSGCTTGANSYDTCTISVTWPVAFPDTNYVASCTPYGVTSSQGAGILTSSGIVAPSTDQTTTGITWTWATDAAQALTITGMRCTGIE